MTTSKRVQIKNRIMVISNSLKYTDRGTNTFTLLTNRLNDLKKQRKALQTGLNKIAKFKETM